jgi:hypothetical protein
MALFFFFAAFLPADFNFRFRIAFFVVALRFLGMIFLSQELLAPVLYRLFARRSRVVRL